MKIFKQKQKPSSHPYDGLGFTGRRFFSVPFNRKHVDAEYIEVRTAGGRECVCIQCDKVGCVLKMLTATPAFFASYRGYCFDCMVGMDEDGHMKTMSEAEYLARR